MSSEQMRVYEEVRKYCVSHLDDEEFMTANNDDTIITIAADPIGASGHFKSDLGEIIDLLIIVSKNSWPYYKKFREDHHLV